MLKSPPVYVLPTHVCVGIRKMAPLAVTVACLAYIVYIFFIIFFFVYENVEFSL